MKINRTTYKKPYIPPVAEAFGIEEETLMLNSVDVNVDPSDGNGDDDLDLAKQGFVFEDDLFEDNIFEIDY